MLLKLRKRMKQKINSLNASENLVIFNEKII